MYSSIFDKLLNKNVMTMLYMLLNFSFENWEHKENTSIEIVCLAKSFPTSIWSKKSAPIQLRTERLKFGNENACIDELSP